ncbi:MAG: hypothetical protein RIE08_08110 [Acidimicrobiales bacterium]
MRWSTDECAHLLRDVLGGAHRADVPAPANFGVVVGGTVDGVTTKHTLYRANRRVLRTRSMSRVARALVRGLGEHAMAAPGDECVDLEAVVVVAGDTATLVDRRLAWVLDDHAADIAKAGLKMVDTGVVRVDLGTSEVDLTLPGEWDRRWRNVDVDRPDRLEMRHPAARYPLSGVIIGGIIDSAVPLVVSAMSLCALTEPIPLAAVERWVEVGAGIDIATYPGVDEMVAALTA